MPWRWTPYIDAKVRDTVAREVLGGTATIQTAKGEALAVMPLVGKLDTVIVTATAKGRAATVIIQNAAGDRLGAVPAPEVCDRTEVEPGARVTLTLRVA